MKSAGRVAAKYSVSVSSGSNSTSGQCLTQIRGTEHNNDTADDARYYAKRCPSKHPENADGYYAQDRQTLAERAKDKRANIIEHGLRIRASADGLGMRCYRDRKGGRSNGTREESPWALKASNDSIGQHSFLLSRVFARNSMFLR
jgi:hypothetical protein